jgi:hypothetical protein
MSTQNENDELSLLGRWWDGITLYFSFAIACVIVVLPGALLAVIANSLGCQTAANCVYVLFSLTVGPFVLSKVFRSIDGPS